MIDKYELCGAHDKPNDIEAGTKKSMVKMVAGYALNLTAELVVPM